MKSEKYNRKNFLTTIASTTGGILFNTMLPVSSAAQNQSFFTDGSENEYLFSEGLTYLNTGTLGPCRRETIEESLKMWKELESLPPKFYGKFGAEVLTEKTRNLAARFLGCTLDEILITNSTTSGMNAIAQGLRLKAGDRILTTNQEHGGGLLCWNYFAKYYSVIIDKINIPPDENDAALILKRVKDNLRKKTKLISVSHIFSSTGLRMPIAEISSLARSNGTLCIVDGAQAAGAIEVNVKKLGCHAYATSGHKWLMGPKGTGLLYLSKDVQDIIRPMQFEESYNTYNDGNGVVNLACILGLGKAIEYLESIGLNKIEEHNLVLRNRLYGSLIDLKNVTILSPEKDSLASPMLTLLLSDRFESTSFVKMLLDKYKISIRPTHKEFGFNGIRFSVHIFNTEKEIDFASEVMHKELT
ncbi:MAG: aminotransferase class V-fold PLP-dependent enzyme [Chitinophagaceae bacterium]|jgi:selenocysteine lyase/cysteine desulfurase|nr:aminotransferase class V-fold PLP-dependent enzyme [Chitinophagaceae bacterium]